MIQTFCLPWPARELSPNFRGHWAVKARAVKAARRTAYFQAFDSRRPVPGGAITVTLEFTPPDNRPRDADNMVASSKAYLDGIAEALGVNDKRFAIEISTMLGKKPGGVRITVVSEDAGEAAQRKAGAV